MYMRGQCFIFVLAKWEGGGPPRFKNQRGWHLPKKFCLVAKKRCFCPFWLLYHCFSAFDAFSVRFLLFQIQIKVLSRSFNQQCWRSTQTRAKSAKNWDFLLYIIEKYTKTPEKWPHFRQLSDFSPHPLSFWIFGVKMRGARPPISSGLGVYIYQNQFPPPPVAGPRFWTYF